MLESDSSFPYIITSKMSHECPTLEIDLKNFQSKNRAEKLSKTVSPKQSYNDSSSSFPLKNDSNRTAIKKNEKSSILKPVTVETVTPQKRRRHRFSPTKSSFERTRLELYGQTYSLEGSPKNEEKERAFTYGNPKRLNKKLAELNKEQAKLNKKAKYYQSPQISEKSSSIKNRNFKREKIDNRSFENANLENQKFEDEKSFSVSSRKNSITDSDEENKEKFENSLFEEEEEEYFANSFNEENIKGTPSNLYDDDGNNEEEEEFDQNESDEQSSIKSFSDNEKMSQEEIEKEEEEVWQMIDKMIDTIRARSKYFRELYDKAEADIENAKQLQSSSGSSHSSKQIEKLAHMKAFKKRRVKQSIIEHSPTISYNENSLDKYLHRNIQNFEIFDLNPIRANKHPDSCIIKKSQTPQILSKSHFSPKLQDMKPMQSPSSFNFDEFNQIEETSQPRSKTYNAKNLQTNPTKNKSSTQKYPTFNKEIYDQQYENENFASSTSSKSRKSVSSSTMRRKNPNQRKILIFADGEAQTEPVSSSEIY